MLKVALYLVAVGAICIVAVWLAAHPGSVVIQWEGVRIDTSLLVMGLGVAALAIVLAVLFRLWSWLRSRPHRMAERRKEQRRRHGYRALTHGLVAAAAGDTREAKNAAKAAEGLLGEPPLTMLLAAQAAQLEGDDVEAERQFRLMLENPETEFLGLRGLMVQAEKRGDHARARELAERAFKLRPSTPWVQRHLLGEQAASGDWAGAMKTVDAAVKTGTLTHEQGRRDRAIFLYQQALEAEEAGDRRHALSLAKDAHDREPNFIPATVLAARLMSEDGKTRQAARLVDLSWTNGPHPRLAAVYGDLDGADSMKRLKRLEHLATLAPDSAEGHVAAGEAAIAAEMWGKAREHLEMARTLAPTIRVYRLLSRLEEAESGDSEAARRWLLMASSAAPDPVWLCDRCGAASAVWHVHCGNCGAFDSMTWRSPPATPLALAHPEEAEEPNSAETVVEAADGPPTIEHQPAKA
ncbi:MAG: heme biosynthesis protein HemY [Rhodospirillaceae bacterium]|nr:heme biosynthesis protein HemY [Rhodospirillaceae bacterium]